MIIHAEPLTQVAFAPYGNVISADADASKTKMANAGTAKRYNDLSPLINLRPDQAKPNVCVFRSASQITSEQKEFEIHLLEQHAFSTQVFIPMNGVEKYLVVVATRDSTPSLKTLKAFIATGKQGISYHPGTWHHPLIAINNESDFACIVYEDQSQDDAEIFKTPNIIIKI